MKQMTNLERLVTSYATVTQSCCRRDWKSLQSLRNANQARELENLSSRKSEWRRKLETMVATFPSKVWMKGFDETYAELPPNATLL
jgi:hypothetical protein